MADKYINEVGLQAVKQWIEGKFALDSDVDTLSERVDEIVSEGGEPNTINTVKVNGTALTPDSEKAVDVTVPTRTSQLINDGAPMEEGADPIPYVTEGSLSSYVGQVLNNLIDSPEVDDTQAIASWHYVNENGGKIDKIKVNGTEQTIANKEVDIAVPTQVSDLNNDSNFQTSAEVQTAISQAVASAYKYKGSVAAQTDLPTNAETGDVYDVQTTGMNYAWNGTAWDALGQYVDTSVLWTNAEGQTNSLTAMTTAEINAILNPEG